jgi:hypothetical protein
MRELSLTPKRGEPDSLAGRFHKHCSKIDAANSPLVAEGFVRDVQIRTYVLHIIVVIEGFE